MFLQDCQNFQVDSDSSDTEISFTFTRAFDTCHDNEDYVIEVKYFDDVIKVKYFDDVVRVKKLMTSIMLISYLSTWIGGKSIVWDSSCSIH